MDVNCPSRRVDLMELELILIFVYKTYVINYHDVQDDLEFQNIA